MLLCTGLKLLHLWRGVVLQQYRMSSFRSVYWYSIVLDSEQSLTIRNVWKFQCLFTLQANDLTVHREWLCYRRFPEELCWTDLKCVYSWCRHCQIIPTISGVRVTLFISLSINQPRKHKWRQTVQIKCHLNLFALLRSLHESLVGSWIWEATDKWLETWAYLFWDESYFRLDLWLKGEE